MACEIDYIEQYSTYHVSDWHWNGYTDQCGEWHSTGGGSFYIKRGGETGLLHNYTISIDGENKKYHIRIYQCLKGFRSNEIFVINKDYKRKKDLYSEIHDLISVWDKSQNPNIQIVKWKMLNSRPVFIYENDKLMLVGTHYGYWISNDIEKPIYIHDDVPRRSKDGIYYTLTNWCREKIHITKERDQGSYKSSEGVKNENLLSEMLNLIWGIEKYKWILDIANKESVSV